jgi:hypothetical protein
MLSSSVDSLCIYTLLQLNRRKPNCKHTMISVQKQSLKVKIHIEHDVKQKKLGTSLSNNKIKLEPMQKSIPTTHNSQTTIPKQKLTMEQCAYTQRFN